MSLKPIYYLADPQVYLGVAHTCAIMLCKPFTAVLPEHRLRQERHTSTETDAITSSAPPPPPKSHLRSHSLRSYNLSRAALACPMADDLNMQRSFACEIGGRLNFVVDPSASAAPAPPTINVAPARSAPRVRAASSTALSVFTSDIQVVGRRTAMFCDMVG